MNRELQCSLFETTCKQWPSRQWPNHKIKRSPQLLQGPCQDLCCSVHSAVTELSRDAVLCQADCKMRLMPVEGLGFEKREQHKLAKQRKTSTVFLLWILRTALVFSDCYQQAFQGHFPEY